MHLYSLCQTCLNLMTQTVSKTERQDIMPDYVKSDNHLQSDYQTDYILQQM